MSEKPYEDFDFVYRNILRDLMTKGEETINRKGESLTELVDYKFSFSNPLLCIAERRQPSADYLKGELDWYISGSLEVEDAARLSKFWRKCSDDGCTVNSNYGYLLFHEEGGAGTSQFEHALRCLQNNLRSKKAVMTLYNPRHAYISNDNPCTMFVQLHVNKKSELNITVHMRSSDVYFGLPYDVPFFCFVLYAAYRVLVQHDPNLKLGSYTHIAGSLHKYGRNEEKLAAMLEPMDLDAEVMQRQELYVRDLFDRMYEKLAKTCPLSDETYLRVAWAEAENSSCLKKKVGAAMVDGNGFIHASHGGKEGDPCKFCVREMRDLHEVADRERRSMAEVIKTAHPELSDEELHDRIFASTDKWHGDECPSVHSEMRLLTEFLRECDGEREDLSKAVIYVTHGPCDACLKLIDLVGIRNVVWDVPYKTNYAHWPRLNIRRRLSYFGEPCKPGTDGLYDNKGYKAVLKYLPETAGLCDKPGEAPNEALIHLGGASRAEVSQLITELDRLLRGRSGVIVSRVRNCR